MRLPKKPPSTLEVLEILNETGDLLKIATTLPDSMADGRYVHWDKLRYLTPPAGLTTRQWWAGLKVRRMMQWREVPLLDRAGRPFRFAVVPALLESLHEVDLTAGGPVRMPDIVSNAVTKDRLLVRSLIEEAFTSSQLEGAGTTRARSKELIRRSEEPRVPGERMVLNNYRVMSHLLTLGEEAVTPEGIFDIHRMITQGTLDDPSASGRFRGGDEYRVVSDHFGEVVYHEPPDSEQLPERMRRMCDFANGTDGGGFIHPVIRSMILHFWLAYDHPFVDGNGRTARVLFYWSMLRHNYWLFEFVSISNILLRGPAKYERAFLETETDDNDLTYFLAYHLQVIVRAVEEMHAYVHRKMGEVRSGESFRGLKGLNRRQQALIFDSRKHPDRSFTVEGHRLVSGVVTQTARTDLLGLVDRGLFLMQKAGRAFEFRPVPDLESRLRGPG